MSNSFFFLFFECFIFRAIITLALGVKKDVDFKTGVS